MRKLSEFDGETARYDFTVEMFWDSEKNVLVAKLNGNTPKMPQEVREGEVYTAGEHIKEEEFRDTDQERLIERCKTRIKEIDGELIFFQFIGPEHPRCGYPLKRVQ